MRGENFSDYYDSAEDVTISRERVCQELKAHGLVDLSEFFEEVGEKSSYLAQDVLDWLGY